MDLETKATDRIAAGIGARIDFLVAERRRLGNLVAMVEPSAPLAGTLIRRAATLMRAAQADLEDARAAL